MKINSLQIGLKDVNEYLKDNMMPLTEKLLRDLASSCLQTKIRNSEILVDD